jgi:hypothetical protein
MIRLGSPTGFQIDAKIANPNNFAVFDASFNCDIEDDLGNDLASRNNDYQGNLVQGKSEWFDA